MLLRRVRVVTHLCKLLQRGFRYDRTPNRLSYAIKHRLPLRHDIYEPSLLLSVVRQPRGPLTSSAPTVASLP